VREFFFILIVLLLLLAITAIRYRKQIKAAIEVYKLIKAKDQSMRNANITEKSAGGNKAGIAGSRRQITEMVNCIGCGKWMPAESAVAVGQGLYFCSNKCLKSRAK
jgi:hypothetical protein